MRFVTFATICSLLFASLVSGVIAQTVPIHELTLQQIQQKLNAKELSLKDIATHYVKRIEALDKQGPSLNSITQIAPDLDAQISKLQSKLDHNQPMGSLAGAFVLVKDNVDIDTMKNTAGSYVLRDHQPQDNAFVIDQLLAADAIILGKTNLSEWANFRSSYSSSGWSSLHGQTRNAHDVTRSPCGSSSGSGVAVAAGFSLLAIGTETDGSVTCPAAVNGIVGIKPTLGLVSRDGVIPIAHSQDTTGPMAKTVTDAVLMLEAMMGKDSTDSASISPIALSKHLLKDGLKGKRIGVVRNLGGYNEALDVIFKQRIEQLKAAGATVIEDLSLNRNWGGDEYQVLKTEFKAGLNTYLKQSNAPVKSLAQVIERNKQHSKITMPHFGQDILIESENDPDVNSEEYKNALSNGKRKAGVEGIDALLKQHDLDLLIAPTTSPAWKIDLILGDHFLGSASSAAAVAGYPHITVPMGFIEHLPVSMSFFAGKLAEPTLVEAAYSFEQLTQARKPPVLKP